MSETTTTRSASVVNAVVLTVLLVLAGFLFGKAMAHIPTPQHRFEFWVSNLAAPWIVLPFLAGYAVPRRVLAPAAGALTCIASISGFYWQVIQDGVLVSIAKWVLLATVAGALYGYAGRAWRLRRSRVAAIALTAPAILEFLLWTVRDGTLPQPYIMWLAEAGVGVLVLLAMLRAAGRS
ncbi:DUF6518 family protein [Actinoplanes sp. KI2]|uniref:DUF6518 family protein n=1 Tax=Actinoplanes sp. KI2 TaxID=2983315 RepID=UPI0021D59A43|nr:DUF6518 family protein [Actinoplanes sp. KI2]MCU7728398.1 DUF6518 family protein [Actinoplanes sp. KI2]